jgi:hypothetical protein
LNVKSWYQFCGQVIVGRTEAKKRNKNWGRAYGQDSDADDSAGDGQVDFGRAGVSADEVNDYKRSLQPKIKKKPKRKSRAKDKGKQVIFLFIFFILVFAESFELRRRLRHLLRK